MNSFGPRLDGIEAQSTNTIRRYNPIRPIMNRLWCTESEPEFFTKINLLELSYVPQRCVKMNPETFAAVSAGDKKLLAKYGISGSLIAELRDGQGDSVLHLAASWGNAELVETFVTECPSLLLMPNSKEQLPLHVAAHAGQLNIVKALVATIKYISSNSLEEERLYVVKDKDGNTPLHLALKVDHVKTAACLVNANRQASFLADKDGISPLYMAVRDGNVLLVKEMLKDIGDNELKSVLEGKNILAHAAMKARNTDILDIILKKYPSLEYELDGEGMSCLSVGASIGFNRGVRYLLNRQNNKEKNKNVFVCNKEGSFPIHIAMKKRHIYLLSAILKCFPESKYLLNKKGQNILHIAADSGKIGLIFFTYLMGAAARSIFLRDGRFSPLVEKQDVDGNTPLHLATINWRPRTVFCLLCHYNRKCMATRNNEGKTALDIAKKKMNRNYIFRERVTLLVLLYFYVISKGFFTPKMFTEKITKQSDPPAGDKNKDYVNTLLVVSALVATVTFAAGFTIPGGFNSSVPNQGRATLANEPKLICFMAFDILAMLSSIVTISTLIWAQLADPSLVHRSLNTVTLPLLYFSLLCMSVAFYCGVWVAFEHIIGFVVVLKITFYTFLFLMLFLLGAHVIIQIPGIPAIFGPYFLLFVLFLDDDYHEQASAE